MDTPRPLTAHMCTHASAHTVLLQGCRSLEIDCWDGRSEPTVTHGTRILVNSVPQHTGRASDTELPSSTCRLAGHTFVTLEKFEVVAEAIAEVAFVVSELPVVLSLEMHCSRKQQNTLAKAMMKHFAAQLLPVRTTQPLGIPTV